MYRATTEKQTERIDLRTWGGGGEDAMHGESNWESYITTWKMGSQGDLLCGSGNSNRGSVSTCRGGTGRRGEGAQEGGDMCVPMADSC